MENKYTENEDINGTESENEDFLVLTSVANGRIYYAFRCADSFRIVTVTDKFTEDAEQQLRREDCTEEQANALGVKCLFLPIASIKSVSYDTAEGGAVVFNTGKKKHRYNLFDEYSEERINAFFEGVPQTELAEKAKKVKSDWRTCKQSSSVMRYLKYISVGLNVVSVLLGGLCAFTSLTPRWLFFIVTLVLWVLALGLCVGLPAYFTPFSNKERKKLGYTTYAADLQMVIGVLPCCMMLSFLDSFTVIKFSGYLMLIAIGLAATLGFLLVMHRLCKDFKNHRSIGLVVFGMSVLAFFALAGYANHYFSTDVQYQPCTVTKLVHKESTKSDNYYCGITTPDGKQASISIKGSTYRSLDEGDTIRAYIGTGALGVEYACVEDN